jgi:(p)ppGpp synthase/HD superfamily hydrolase
MKKNIMYQEALKFIAKKHAGKKRRNGNPYIIHPIRVSQEVKSDAEKVIALLHDVLEDSDATPAEIEEVFGTEVAVAVSVLTHCEEEDYTRYILRIKTNPKATAVKIADIADNLGDSPSSNAITKYALALDMLIN